MTEAQCKLASASTCNRRSGGDRLQAGCIEGLSPSKRVLAFPPAVAASLLSLATERPWSADAPGRDICAVDSSPGPLAPCPSCIRVRCQGMCHPWRGCRPSIVLPAHQRHVGSRAGQSKATEALIPSVGPNSPVGWVPESSSLDRWGNRGTRYGWVWFQGLLLGMHGLLPLLPVSLIAFS